MRQTILLVDDQEADLYLYSRILRQAGYRPLTTLIGYEFMSIHESEKPALILLDYVLNSSIEARDLVNLFRQIFAGVPILVLSVLEKRPHDLNGLVDDFLQKGDPDQLLAKIRCLLSPGASSPASAEAN
jgi:DNA-binding response OmpR family regulator